MQRKRSLLGSLLRRTKQHAYQLREKTVYALDLDRVDIAKNLTDTTVYFKLGEFCDVERISQLPGLDYDKASLAFAKDRLKHGDKIIIGYLENTPVCYGWIMFDQMDLQYKNYHALPKHAAYSYKIYVSPSVRRMGLYQAYYRFMIKHLREEKIKYLLTWIDNTNLHSINAHKKFGLSPIGTIHSRNFFGLKRHRLTLNQSQLSGEIFATTPNQALLIANSITAIP